MLGYKLDAADVAAITKALNEGLDVRIHPDRYGVKITSEKVRVLRKPMDMTVGAKSENCK